LRGKENAAVGWQLDTGDFQKAGCEDLFGGGDDWRAVGGHRIGAAYFCSGTGDL
jgi:hypothetical protein